MLADEGHSRRRLMRGTSITATVFLVSWRDALRLWVLILNKTSSILCLENRHRSSSFDLCCDCSNTAIATNLFLVDFSRNALRSGSCAQMNRIMTEAGKWG